MQNDQFTPEGVANAAKNMGDDIRQTASETANAYQNSAKAAGERIVELNTALLGMFQDNMQNVLNHMQHLASARTWPDMLNIQSQFLQQQMHALTQQADTIRNCWTAVVADGAQPVADQAKATADNFGNHQR